MTYFVTFGVFRGSHCALTAERTEQTGNLKVAFRSLSVCSVVRTALLPRNALTKPERGAYKFLNTQSVIIWYQCLTWAGLVSP
jgi:hypothetical protein